jgi:hypothetical protein
MSSQYRCAVKNFVNPHSIEAHGWPQYVTTTGRSEVASLIAFNLVGAQIVALDFQKGSILE